MKTLILSLIVTISTTAAFAEQSLMCEPAKGNRVDYFTYNVAKEPNNTFIANNNDQSLRTYLVIRDKNQGIQFSIGSPADKKAKQANMRSLYSSDDQLSFSGMVNDMYTLATYYPNMKVLIYSQQSSWPGPDLLGATATLLYANCVDFNPNQ